MDGLEKLGWVREDKDFRKCYTYEGGGTEFYITLWGENALFDTNNPSVKCVATKDELEAIIKIMSKREG